jgi:hypothetical protein
MEGLQSPNAEVTARGMGVINLKGEFKLLFEVLDESV